MIKSFKCIETEKVWHGIKSRRLPQDIQNRVLRKLHQLDVSACLQDLRNPPGNHLEQLSGYINGRYSIRINNQWRLCFYWNGQDSYEVEVIDYH